MSDVKFLKGLSSNWQPTNINQDYFYIVQDENDTSKLSLYLGSTLLADGHAAEDLAKEIEARIASDEYLETKIAELESSLQGTIAEEIAKIVNNADESFDTLKEIADWIVNDTTGAAKMANDIKANAEAISAEEERAKNAENILQQQITYNSELITSSYNSLLEHIETEVEDRTSADDELQTQIDELVSTEHTHDNKNTLDNISDEKVASWDAAEQNAKDYADGLLTWGSF